MKERRTIVTVTVVVGVAAVIVVDVAPIHEHAELYLTAPEQAEA
jgi:hypothetical protein